MSKELAPIWELVESIDKKSGHLIPDEVSPYYKEYSPWTVNGSFSQAANTVLFANEMNKYYSLDKKLQYDFYYYGIPKSKQWRGWNKGSTDKNVKLIQRAYGVNRQKAEVYLKILTEEQIESINIEMNPGGKNNK